MRVSNRLPIIVIVFLMVLSLCISAFGQPAETEREDRTNSVASAAIGSLETYRWSKLEDLYKLVHQASLGPGHLNVAWENMLAYLEREWAEIEQLEQPRIHDTLVEDLGGSFVRVNMVPYLSQGGERDSLAMALYRSLTVPPDSTLLFDAWNETCELMLAGDPTLQDHISTFTNLMREDGWPAVHHSQRYANQYQPHYRVLARAEADSLVVKLK